MTDEEFIRKHIEVEKSLCEAVKKAKANAKSEVLQALEDVRAKVHANILMFRNEHYENKEVATGCDKLIESINDYIDRKIKEISGKDCRDCKKWNDCECGKKGHDNGTSIGYSVGECGEYEVTKSE